MFDVLTDENKKELQIVQGEVETVNNIKVVQDNEEIKTALLNGEEVMHWEFGDSMFPMLLSGEYCHIKPLTEERQPKIGDALFCGFKSGPREYLMVHRCTDIIERNNQKYYLISTTEGTMYGWTPLVYGIAYSTNVLNSAAFAFGERKEVFN